MKLRDKIQSFKAILKVRYLQKRIPLAVRFQLTNRCTLQCKYCNIWHKDKKELSTQQIIRILEELYKLGTKRISFSGGEPLLRNDIDEIITFCNKKGIYPEMNSNGTLVRNKLDTVKKLDFLKLSLDGPQEVHNAVRGEGSYQKVIEAADIVFENKVNFGFACTMTRYNINCLDHILEMAKRYNTIVAFQPLKQFYRGVENIKDFMPSQHEFRAAVTNLINQKTKENNNLRNSLAGLKHIYNWPEYSKLECWAGRIFCIIDTNGDLYPCDRIDYDIEPPNSISMGVQKAINMFPIVYCDGCGFCGALELNYLMRLRFDIISSIRKIIIG